MARVTVTVETEPDEEILAALTDLEDAVTTQSEAIQGLTAKVEDIAGDFAAFKEAMEAERENLSEAGQAALDVAITKLGELDVAVGEHDQVNPPPVEPEPIP